VTGVRDLGRSALLDIETETETTGGTLLFTTRFGIVLRGEGGFDKRCSAGRSVETALTGAAQHRFVVRTSPRQAAIYRLTGDRNPLHIDPGAARAAGFGRPILHGLSTYGAVLRAIVDGALDGAVERVVSFTARFENPVFPGDEIEVEAWRTTSGVRLDAWVRTREVRVLTHAVIGLAGAESEPPRPSG
jgi:acyl dehydratase